MAMATKVAAVMNAAVSAASSASMPLDQMRGLHKFIKEVRESGDKEKEQARVDKELANIRAKFSSSGGLTSYAKKKYVWKLVYIFMLGYEVEFGHMEMISLMSSPKYSEKAVGYIAVSLLLRSGDEMMTLVINSMKNDLTSHSNPSQTLALATIANLGGSDLREGLFSDVAKLLQRASTGEADAFVKKKAALCLLRFFRESPANATLVHSEWANSLAGLLEDKHLGVVMSCLSLLQGFAHGSAAEYEKLVPYVILLLTRLVVLKACSKPYLYCETPNPWMQVRLLRFLQLYPPPSDAGQREKLNEALTRILNKTEVSDSINKSNADHAILFEAINLIIHHGEASNSSLRSQAMHLLGRFIAVKEPNIRYLGLETLSRLARLEGNEGIKKHKATVIVSLKDADISMRRRALDLLFVMSDKDNAVGIVEELMTYLSTSDAAIREEMVLKIAILAEKYARDMRWYVDKMLEMIEMAGDHVAIEVWHRIIQIITNNKELQAYAAELLFKALQSKRVHETAVNVGGYIIGEFGFFIAEKEGMSGTDQFNALHAHFLQVSPATRALLLSTYVKLANLYPECKDLVNPVFNKYSVSTDLELQQRSCEYLALPTAGADVMEEVLKEMPPFPEDRESGPEARLRHKLETAEKGALGTGGPGGSTGDEEGAENGDESQASQPSQPAVVSDLLGVGDDDYATPAAPPVSSYNSNPSPNPSMGASPLAAVYAAPAVSGEVVGIPPEMGPALMQCFKALTVSPKGILFENAVLRVGIVQEYRATQGMIMLYYYNLSSMPMANFKVDVPPPPHLRIQSDVPPPHLEAGGQSKQQIMCECQQPFVATTDLKVEFELGGRKHSYGLRLPIVATSFMEPAPLTPEDFSQRWQMLVGEEREQREILSPSMTIDLAFMARLREIISTGMKMGLTVNQDPNGLTITAAGTFRTAGVAPNGSKISIGTMLMIEVNPQAKAVCITSRAVHGMVAQAVKNVLRLQLQ